MAQGEDIRKPAPKIPTVAEAFKAVITGRSRSWKGKETEGSWCRSMEYSKAIGSKLVSEVKSSDIVAIINPLWHDKLRTAQMVRMPLSTVMKWAMANEHRTNNPAEPGVTQQMRNQRRSDSQLSLDYPLLGSALAKVRDADAWWAPKGCLLFIAFTCARSGEARMANWDEIDLDESTWTIPASHMKTDLEHRVPLSTQAKGLLAHAREQTDPSENRIFPPQRGGEYIGNHRLSRLLRKLEIPTVPSGFRASFRNWAGGRADIAQPVAEMVLAHYPTDPVMKALMTSNLFEKRQPLMQEWADFLTETMGTVIPTMQDVAGVRPNPQRPSTTYGP